MAGVEEQEIMRRTGHRSEKTERKYCNIGSYSWSGEMDGKRDIATHTDLSCRPTNTLHSFSSDITYARNGQYLYVKNTISFN